MGDCIREETCGCTVSGIGTLADPLRVFHCRLHAAAEELRAMALEALTVLPPGFKSHDDLKAAVDRSTPEAELPEEEIVRAMILRGGSFVRALAEAWRKGDPLNRVKLRAAFPGYWRQYAEVAKRAQERSVK